MTSESVLPAGLLFSRLLVAGFFAIAGFAKSSNTEAFATHLYRNRLIPARVVPSAARVLPALELLLAGWLASGITSQQAGSITVALLLLFTGLFIANWVISGDESCGCLGALSADRPASITILRNVLLGSLAGIVALKGSGPYTIASVLRASSYSADARAEAIVTLLITVAVLLLIVAAEQLSRQRAFVVHDELNRG